RRRWTIVIFRRARAGRGSGDVPETVPRPHRGRGDAPPRRRPCGGKAGNHGESSNAIARPALPGAPARTPDYGFLPMTAQPSPPTDVTRLLAHAREGDREAIDRLFPMVYDELRNLANRQVRGSHSPPTIQA